MVLKVQWKSFGCFAIINVSAVVDNCRRNEWKGSENSGRSYLDQQFYVIWHALSIWY